MVWVWLVLLVVLTVWVGWRLLGWYFLGQHFTKNYLPIPLEPASINGFPSNHHLEDVPWHCTRETYCESSTLQSRSAASSSRRGQP
jgi:hypothetical protein